MMKRYDHDHIDMILDGRLSLQNGMCYNNGHRIIYIHIDQLLLEIHMYEQQMHAKTLMNIPMDLFQHGKKYVE